MRRIAIANQKGGVGKTTTAVTLAHALARFFDAQVLLVDADPQGHVAPCLGLRADSGLFDLLISEREWSEVARKARANLLLIPGNKRTQVAEMVLSYLEAADGPDSGGNVIAAKIESALPVHGEIDFVIFDTAPSVGKLQESVLRICEMVIIPTATDFLSSAGVGSMIETLGKLKKQGWAGGIFGILPTFYDDVTRESAQTLEALEKEFGELVLSPIHRATVLRECSASGETIFEFALRSRAAEEYDALAERVWNG